MFRTKKDVDRHVADILSKINNENERNLRGYTFAKLYYVVKDFESAKRYLSGFLSLKEKNPTAHKLMAQIYENTGQLEKAVQSYKKSLELEENQKDVVLKICELYCQLTVDPDRARYWADRAEKLFPHNDIVFRLRECIMSADGSQNSQELEDLISAELASRPRDVKLRIKLLRLYLDTERIHEAYEHAVQVESKKPHFNSLDWYYCLNDVFESYLEDNTQECNKDFYINFLSATDRLVYLILEEKRKKEKFKKNNQTSSIADSATALNSFDQHLYKAMQLNEKHEDAWKAFLNHMNGQLYFHFGTLILIRAKKDQANMKEAILMGSTLLLLSYMYKPLDLQSSWFSQASEAMQKVYHHWYEQACFRLSQCGHVVIGLCQEDRVKWLQKLKQQIQSPSGKEKIFQRVFSSREYRESVATSQFMKSSLSEFTPEFPDIKALHEYDDVAALLYPNSLHHIVWLALQYYNVKDKVQPDYGFKIFEGLQFSVNNLNTSAPETLCQLDIDSFLYATVRTCALALEERQTIMYTSVDISTHLPVNISDWLCTQEQAQWWSAAYTLFKNIANENFGDLRRILQHGIEVVRVMGCHGMDVNLVIHLAETFADRTSELKNQVDNELDRANEINSLGNRAAHFWKAAVGMLEKLANNQTYRIPKSRLFESYNADPSTEEVKKLLESGHFYLACQSMNAGHHEEAITAFEGLKSAYASFYQAVIYKKLAAEEYNKPRETITSEMRSKHIILLTRARDALYVTLDRIRGDRKHPLNTVLCDEIEDIETKLARIDPDTAQRHEFDGLSDEMLSSQESVEQEELESPNPHRNPENQHHSHKHQDSRRNRGSQSLLQNIPALSLPFVTPPNCDPSPEHISRHREEHNRPSPERLDAQMRSLAYSHDAVIKTIMEQNKALIETNRSIVEELKQNKIVVEQLKGQLEDIHKQILVSRSRRRKFSKISLMGRHTQQVNGATQVDVEDNPEEEEDYYPGYYYEDDIGYELDEPENAFHDYTYNAAYKYPDAQLQNDYPYGQVTGLHGTSTVTYAPPAGRNIGVPPHHPQSSYAAYYSQSHHTVPTLGNPRGPSILHGHSSHPASALASPQLGPGYFSTPTTAISARLPFSEGQKLPEFNFNTAPAVPSPSLPLTVDKNIYSQVGTVGQPQIVMPAPLEPPGGTSSSNPVTGAIAVSSSQAYISPPKHSSSPSTHSTLDTNRLRKEAEVKERTVSEGDSYQEEEYSGPDFKPVIPLPAEVEIKTGEEEENKLFEERAKLFRFVDKEWKERGTGVVKILHNESTGKVRLLMRRDQILKVCANHYIIPDMKLSPMKNSETAWVWAAQDFADEEVRTEQFCIRFKTVEIAQKFKKEFDNARELVAKANSNAKGSTAVEQKPVKASEGFGDEFKPKPGTWECPTCLINNLPDKLSCPACETPKPGLKTTEDKTSVASKFVFGGTSSGFNFYTSGSQQSNTSSVSTFIMPSSGTGTTTTSTSFICSVSTNTMVPSLSTPVFGFPSTTSASANATTKTFTFGINPASASRSESTAASTIAAVSSPHTVAFGTPSVTPTKAERPEPFIFETPVNNQSNNKGSPAFVFGSSGSSPQQSKPSGFVFGASTLPKDSEKSAEEVSPGPASVLLSALASKHQEFEAFSSSNQETKTISYGGFTFTGTPNIKVTNDSTSKKEIKTSPLKAKELVSKDEAIKLEQPKLSPFAGFSFNISKQDSSKSVSSQPFTETSKTTQSSIPSFIQNVSPDLSFQAIAKSASETPVVKRDPNFTGFKGVGQRLFESVGASGDQQESPETTPTEFESTAEFKPVIPMPELVELKTGEEEEDKLFAERAKLFRYDFSVKQWKERGIGEMKILQHKDNKRCRILMRREQVFKICANHYILKNMELKTLLSSEKAWTWFANDFSDGVIKPEHLAVKFKTIDIAKRFQKVFMSCVELAAKKDTESAVTPPKDTEVKVDDRPLSEIFKNEAGSWECKSCLLVNKPAVMKCLACEAERPAKAVADQSVSSSNQSNSVFGLSSFKLTKPNESVDGKSLDSKDTRPLSELFKPEMGSWECSACYVRNKSDSSSCVSCCTPKPGSTSDGKQSDKAAFGPTSTPQFLFGKSTSEGNVGFNLNLPSTPGSGFNFTIPVTTTSATSTTTTSSIKPGFLSSDISTVSVGNTPLSSSTETSSTFQFGFQFGQKTFPSPPKGSNSTDENASAVEFRFGSPQKFTFCFSGVRPKSPAKTPKSPHGTADDSGELSEEVEGESDDHIYFQPVVPLPDKVEVKTGEEDENVLYCQRAKLFRLLENEWKERGLGEFKILQHIETKKIRLLMRREQVLKICLNHYLSTDLKFVEKDEKSWLWVATDFADNEPHQESLAIRFKTSEIAKQFMEAINNAKELLRSNSVSSPAIQKTSADSSVTKTISASNSPSQSQDITKAASPLNTFSFKLDSSKLPETSPTTAFSFGNKFGSTVGYPKATSLFGGSSPKEKGSPPEVSSPSSFSDAADVEIIHVKEATPEQKAKAKALMLPSNFYLYEDAPPCPGCRGCEDRLDMKFSKEEKKDDKDDKPPVLEIQPQAEPDSTTPEVLPCFGNIAAAVDFASIAAKQETASFLNSSPANNFTFTGFGTKVFHNTSQDESEDGNDSNVSSHDPHFEPIVSLPPRVSTVTGEEDEEKIFCQRAKLYRYDNDVKQWKERGIGEMKILKHKQTGKYRLLLRREQVLKIACNHNISPDLELKPLSSSETAWFWVAMDFADETPRFQKLAVRFKTIELAQEFKKKFEECQQELNNSSVLETSKSDSMTVLETEEKENGKASGGSEEATSESSSLTKDAKESKSSESASESVTSNEETGSSSVNPSSTFTPKSNENTEDDDNDDNDEDESVMFEKRVSLSYFDKQSNNYQLAGMGNLRILYDDDVYGARIQVTTDDGQLICNHLIAIQTTLEVNKKDCHWAALDFSKVPPVRRRFRATFSSPAAAEQFSEMFKEGKECAKAVEILERPYDPTMTMEDLINSTVEDEELAWDPMQKDDDIGSWWCQDTLDQWTVVDEKFSEQKELPNCNTRHFWRSTTEEYEFKECGINQGYDHVFDVDSQMDLENNSNEDYKNQDIGSLFIKKLKRMLQPKRNATKEFSGVDNKFDFLLYCSSNNSKMTDGLCFNTSMFVYTCQTETKNNERCEGSKSPKCTLSIDSCDPIAPNEITVKMRTVSSGCEPVNRNENLSENPNRQQECQQSCSREYYAKLVVPEPLNNAAHIEHNRTRVYSESLKMPVSEPTKNPNYSDSFKYAVKQPIRNPALQESVRYPDSQYSVPLEPVRYFIPFEPVRYPVKEPRRYMAPTDTDRYPGVADTFKYSTLQEPERYINNYEPYMQRCAQETYTAPLKECCRPQSITQSYRTPVFAEPCLHQAFPECYKSSVPAEPCLHQTFPEPYKSPVTSDLGMHQGVSESYKAQVFTEPCRHQAFPEPYKSAVLPESCRCQAVSDPYGSCVLFGPSRHQVIPESYRSQDISEPCRYQIFPESYISPVAAEPYRHPVILEPNRPSVNKKPDRKTVGTQADTNLFHVFYAPLRHCCEKCKQWFFDDEEFYSSRQSTESEAAYNTDSNRLPYDINIYSRREGSQDLPFGSAVSASEDSDLPFQDIEDSYRTPVKSNVESQTSPSISKVTQEIPAIEVEGDEKGLQTDSLSPKDAYTIKITCSPRGVENLIIPINLKAEAAQPTLSNNPVVTQENVISPDKTEMPPKTDPITDVPKQEEKVSPCMKSEICQCSLTCKLVDQSSQTLRGTEETVTCYLDCLENKKSESTVPTCIFITSSESYASDTESAVSAEEIPIKKSSSALKIDPCIQIGGMWAIQNKPSNECSGKKKRQHKKKEQGYPKTSCFPLRFSLQPFENVSSSESQLKTCSETHTKASDEEDFYSLAWGYTKNRKKPEYEQDSGFNVYEIGVAESSKPDRKFQSLESCNDGEQWILDMRREDDTVPDSACPRKRNDKEICGKKSQQSSREPVKPKCYCHKKCQTKFKCIKYLPCKSSTKREIAPSSEILCITNKATQKPKRKESAVGAIKQDKGVLIEFHSDESCDRCPTPRPQKPKRVHQKSSYKTKVYICKKVQTDDNSCEALKSPKTKQCQKQKFWREDANSSSEVSISDDEAACNPEYINMLSRMYCSLAPESCQYQISCEGSSGEKCTRKGEDIQPDILSALKKLIKPNQPQSQRAGFDHAQHLIPQQCSQMPTNKNINPNIWNFINQILNECSNDVDGKESYYYDELDIEKRSETVLC